jgi:hypothetical protein
MRVKGKGSKSGGCYGYRLMDEDMLCTQKAMITVGDAYLPGVAQLNLNCASSKMLISVLQGTCFR